MLKATECQQWHIAEPYLKIKHIINAYTTSYCEVNHNFTYILGLEAVFLSNQMVSPQFMKDTPQVHTIQSLQQAESHSFAITQSHCHF
jgi:hypothetical protein